MTDPSTVAYFTSAWLPILAVMGSSYLAGLVWYSHPAVALRAAFDEWHSGASKKDSVNIVEFVAACQRANPKAAHLKVTLVSHKGEKTEGFVRLDQAISQLNESDPSLLLKVQNPDASRGNLITKEIHMSSVKSFTVRSITP